MPRRVMAVRARRLQYSLRMRRRSSVFAALGAMLAWAGCSEFESARSDSSDDADASAGDTATTPGAPSSDAAGFVPQEVPPWSPSWAAEPRAVGELRVQAGAQCEPLPSLGGPLSGSWSYQQGCLSEATLAEPLAQFCPGISVSPQKAMARVVGTLTVSSDRTKISRSGTLSISAELLLPCRASLAKNDCASFGGLVASFMQAGRSDAISAVRCYDTAPDVCTCHVDDVAPFNSKQRALDTTAGHWDEGRFTYALQNGLLLYTGEPSGFSLEPGLVWTLGPVD